MTELQQNDLELMRLHVEALFTHDSRGCMVAVNEPGGAAAPRFFLGRTAAGALWRFGAGLPDGVAGELAVYCRREGETAELPPEPQQREAYLRILAAHAPLRRTWSGPAYAFPAVVVPRGPVVAINEENAHLLQGGFEDWLEDVLHRRPFVAVVEDGRAVSLCASVRITAEAHEAGLETLPAYRRRGHAARAAAGWAAAVRQRGAVPLYSTSWDNTASQKVAASLGLLLYGVDFHAT